MIPNKLLRHLDKGKTMLVIDNDEDSFVSSWEASAPSIRIRHASFRVIIVTHYSVGREVIQGHPGELKEKEREGR